MTIPPNWLSSHFIKTAALAGKKPFIGAITSKLRRWSERLLGALQLPGQVIQVEQQNRLRIYAAKFFKRSPGPTFRQILTGIQVLLKESVLVGDAERVQDSGDHVQMRDQHGLSELCGKFLIAFVDPGPHPRSGLAQMFGVEFYHMRARFEGIVDPVGFELTE